MRYRVTVLLLLAVFALLLGDPGETLAQGGGSCPEIVAQALEAADQLCDATGRNEACYGHLALEAVPGAGVTDFKFTASGDIVSLADLQSLTLSPMDTTAGTWGVAVFRLQANLPDTLPGQNVTMLAFGDVALVNASDPSLGDNPMQVFYFSTGFGDPPCAEAPANGILVQTPQGSEQVSLVINDATIHLSSTAFLQAHAGDMMTIDLLEGSGSVTTADVMESFVGGERISVPLDNNLSAVGTPLPAAPLDPAALTALPLHLLPEPVEMAGAAGSSEPCTVMTTQEGTVLAHVGPGTNRTSLIYLPANEAFLVTGQGNDSWGNPWWEIDVPGRQSLWVNQAEVMASGGCDAVQDVNAPPIIPLAPSPVPTGLPTPTNAPGASINFVADQTNISFGNCTMVRWDVEGVREVYYQGQGVAGHGSRQECPSATTTYTLHVVLVDGSSSDRTVTINVSGGLGTGDVQVTLTWDSAADLDLYVTEPSGETIYFGNPASATGGQLDRDSNFPCGSNPGSVENIFWPTGQAPSGTYTVQVNLYSLCGAYSANWTLVVRVDGQVVLQRTGTSNASYSFTR
ncbi:MAG: hypothetical protein JW910_09665 [Anaerolineae bacterium]|nr:hypothetical protein [Anaerolineae bacterium]